ncbi:MAG: hypothetical protein U0359_04480 [Byssovorax sp.]
MAHRGLITAALAVLAAGCSGAGEGPVTPPPGPSSTAHAIVAQPAFGAGKSGDFVSTRLGLTLPLPDGKSWSIDDHTGSWLVATHAATGSTLSVRTFRVDGAATRARCEEEARLRRKLPDREGAEIVEQHALDVPADFDTRVEVGVVTPLPGGRGAKAKESQIHGFVLAFGGKAHRCFAYAFTTAAEGPGAEQAVGERLATMAQASLAKVKLHSELSPEIGREPLPGEAAPGR